MISVNSCDRSFKILDVVIICLLEKLVLPVISLIFVHKLSWTIISAPRLNQETRGIRYSCFFYTADIYASMIVYLHKIVSTVLNHFCVRRHLDINDIEKCIQVRNDISLQE